jgi:hypothetical protein
VPAVSQAQFRWLHTNSAKKALGSGGVKEWIGATGSPSGLPERSGMAKNWISSAVRRPGALTRAAKEHGLSKLQEATKESHSSNPKIRGRGLLGRRFIKHEV